MSWNEEEIQKTLKQAKEAIESDESISPSAKLIFETLRLIIFELVEANRELTEANRELTEANRELHKTIEELNKKLSLDSKNSSKPPSSDRFPRGHRQGGKRGRSPGGQFGHEGTTLRKIENPDKVENHKPVGKCVCGETLSRFKSTRYLSRQVWDLVIKTVVTEHRAHEVICSCGRSHKADFPKNVTNNTQYGERVKSIASYLSQYQMIPFERSQELFKDLFNIKISQGTVCNANSKLFEHLEGFEKKITKVLRDSSLAHADETGVNIKGKNSYLHVFSNAFYTLLYPHKKRGQKAMDAMNVLPFFKGNLVHDFYKSYLKYNCKHAFCGAHLIRELIFSEEQENQVWARKMRQLLQYSNYLKKKKRLNENQIKKLENKYSEILLKGNLECPLPSPILKRIKTKKGCEIIYFKKRKRSKSRNLLERFENHQEGVLRFLYDPLVPFTNNQGERDLRMSKVRQKISGCFRSLEGARVNSRIRSYISTLKKQHLNVLDEIHNTFCLPNSTFSHLFG